MSANSNLNPIYVFCFCSSLGQNLLTSSNVGEINFAIVIAILGLVLFALLIGNMQVITVPPYHLFPLPKPTFFFLGFKFSFYLNYYVLKM